MEAGWSMTLWPNGSGLLFPWIPNIQLGDTYLAADRALILASWLMKFHYGINVQVEGPEIPPSPANMVHQKQDHNPRRTAEIAPLSKSPEAKMGAILTHPIPLSGLSKSNQTKPNILDVWLRPHLRNNTVCSLDTVLWTWHRHWTNIYHSLPYMYIARICKPTKQALEVNHQSQWWVRAFLLLNLSNQHVNAPAYLLWTLLSFLSIASCMQSQKALLGKQRILSRKFFM